MTEREAIVIDAERKVRECKAAIGEIWNDRDDIHVLCEITMLLSELRAAESALCKPVAV